MDLPAGVRLRAGTPADAEAGAAMHMACWRESYTAYAGPGLLETILADPGAWTQRWREQLARDRGRILAVTDAEEIVGFAAAGPTRDDSADHTGHENGEPDLELYALYTRSAWWGTGLGQCLLEAVLGGRDASLWVLEPNERARGFYARNGFVPDGRRVHDDRLAVDEVRLVRWGSREQ